MKLMGLYKPISFNVTLVIISKMCHTVPAKFTNLCYLKRDELKALDCLIKTTSAFLIINK
ncbi:hypothetical protein P4559_06525 [Priestia filamentosa]|nr:hypothetical protein [Priestia filamentosa]